MIVPTFHGHPRNSAVIATVLFSETRINYKGANVASKGGEGSELLH